MSAEFCNPYFIRVKIIRCTQKETSIIQEFFPTQLWKGWEEVGRKITFHNAWRKSKRKHAAVFRAETNTFPHNFLSSTLCRMICPLISPPPNFFWNFHFRNRHRKPCILTPHELWCLQSFTSSWALKELHQDRNFYTNNVQVSTRLQIHTSSSFEKKEKERSNFNIEKMMWFV